MRNSGMNMVQVKKQNRASIVNCINEQGPVSRKDIAAATGLTPAAVTLLCSELLEQGILLEVGIDGESTGAGRKKVLVDINYDFQYILAINMESEQTFLALSNMRGDCLELKNIPTEKGMEPEEYLRRLGSLLDEMRQKHKALAGRIAGVSVAVPGVVDRERGTSVHAYGIWNREVALCEVLSEELQLPVWVENNVNAFAAAELLYGAGRTYDNLLIVKWGPGVGSTIVIDSRIYEGRHGKAAELGHFVVERNGKPCSCGRRGCLETKVSYQALSRKIPFEQEEFGSAYRGAEQEGRAQPFLEAMDIFARTIVNSMTILAPNRVILCGRMFRDETVRRQLILDCAGYDERYDASRILYTTLAEKEDYIGPVAVFASRHAFLQFY